MILAGARVVDPLNQVDGDMDIAIEDGLIAAVGNDLSPTSSREAVDVSGRVVIPGIVDSHAHLSGPYVGTAGKNGHRMMARVGVTTAIDMAADLEDLTSNAETAGAGLNIAFLLPMVPEDTVATPDPSRREIGRFVEDALSRGALGVKLLGGHYPLTPKAIQHSIEAAHAAGVQIAVHAGSTQKGSNVDGLEELIGLSGGLPVHIAHINAYCRGQTTGDSLADVTKAIALLNRAPWARSEAYLAKWNGVVGHCVSGVPRSDVVKNCLAIGGFEPTEPGLAEAIRSGWAYVHVTVGGETQLITGKSAEAFWRSAGTNVGISFPVNPPLPSIALCLAKRANGGFLVDAISSDGGCIPRNTIVEQGLALVRLGVLTLSEFVIKASLNPSLMFGMKGKGHLGPGADADLTVLDIREGRAVLGIVGGKVIMVDGVVTGTSTTFITTAKGRDYLSERARAVRLVPG
jgi:predicted amidohydrolase